RFANISAFKNHDKFEFIEGDIRNYGSCVGAAEGIDIISHQAALGSVPRSVKDPITTHEVNATGTLNIFNAAREKKIKRVVYAASSSTYGDHPGLPKVEDKIGSPISPYGVTKLVNELYAKVFAELYDMEFIGLRYFNVYGPQQNPGGPYAAVIPLFIKSLLENKSPTINGAGDSSRDFTFVEDVVQANLLAMFAENTKAVNQVYNIAKGEQTTLNELFNMLREISGNDIKPTHGPERNGDIKHSLADITKAKQLLGYDPATAPIEGLRKTFDWYKKNSLIFAA
ncbi:MAG TPA: NAD-dependent epimerase/dehydratase family protein, partial [Chitinophagaceae bacterium]|nr:NAD-dependent epimerase/dehydratase family protein [Chitinophagaceae bacterium]